MSYLYNLLCKCQEKIPYSVFFCVCGLNILKKIEPAMIVGLVESRHSGENRGPGVL